MKIVEDIASQSSVVFNNRYDGRDTISGVHISPGSTEKFVRRGGIPNHHSLSHCFHNICAKNYQNRYCALKLLCAASVSFFETQCTCIVVMS